MKLPHIIYCFSAVLTIAVNAEPISKTITIPFVKTPIKRNHPILERRAKSATQKVFNHQNVGYLIKIDVGTPPQSFDVILDTGSSDTWIPGSSCPSTQCPSVKFDSSSSSTFKNVNSDSNQETNFNITYARGNATGTYATDTISIGGVSVVDQQFGLATNSSIIRQLDNISSSDPTFVNGVLGLGYPDLTYPRQAGHRAYNPLLLNMYNQQLIDSPIFSVYHSSSQNDWSGEITFGGIDSSKYDGQIAYVPVGRSQAPFNYTNWMANAGQFGIDGGNTKFFFSAVSYIFDTSSSFTYLPAERAKEILRLTTGGGPLSIDEESGAYIVGCKTTSTSDFFLTLSDSANVTVTTLYVPLTELLIPTGKSQNGTDLCLFGIAPTNDNNLDLVVIGDSILRSFYTVFDMKENRIGFASLKGSKGRFSSNASRSTKLNAFVLAIFSTLVALSLSAL